MTTTADVRADLASVHDEAWASLSRPGPRWSAAARRALARTAADAMWVADPPPPWVAASSVPGALADGALDAAPAAAPAAAARIARPAATLTRDWYDRVRTALDPLAYVELVGVVCVVAALTSLRRTLGLAPRALDAAPDGPAGDPTRAAPPALAEARRNWVPVAAPADATAAVVQALTAVPPAHDLLWRLAAAQYIPDAEMVDPRWTRGTLTRVEIELVATRVSQRRECHY
ncbi:MAG: hypothetical protein ACO26C_05405 [Ilumatobacteraceae bacterium]